MDKKGFVSAQTTASGGLYGWLVVLVIGLGAGARLFFSGSQSFWYDEIASLAFVRTFSFVEVLYRLPFVDSSPPLYYALLEVWTQVFGISDMTSRVPSILFGLGSIALIYLLGTRLFDPRIGAISALFLSLSRFQVYYSGEVRMYSLLGFLSLLSFLFFWRCYEGKPSRRHLVCYTLATALLGYTHLYGSFVLITQFLFQLVILGLKRRFADRYRNLLVAQALAVVTISPWFWVIAMRMFGIAATSQQDLTGWIPLPGLRSLLGTFVVFVGRSPSELFDLFTLSIIGGVCGAIVWDSLLPRYGEAVPSRDRAPGSLPGDRGGGSDTVLLVTFWLLVPVLLPFALSYLVFPVYLQRGTIVSSPALYLLLSAGLFHWRKRWLSRVAGILLVAIQLYTLSYFLLTATKQEWNRAVGVLDRQAKRGAMVLIPGELRGLSSGRNFQHEGVRLYSERGDLRLISVPNAEDPARYLTARDGAHAPDSFWVLFSMYTPAERSYFLESIPDDFRPGVKLSFKGVVLYRFESQ